MDKRKGFTPLEIKVSNRASKRFLTGFTLVELLVVMPALRLAREQGKRVVCLNNLRQLTLAWILYADDNDGEICTAQVYANNPASWLYISDDGQIFGVLLPYVKNVKLYKCPTGMRGEMVTYSIVASMWGGNTAAIYWDLPKELCIKNKGQIRRPGERFVFLDEGKGPKPGERASPWAVHYEKPTWWDTPTVRHSDGTNWSFADGHAEYHKWRDKRTMDLAELGPGQPRVTHQHNEDLEWAQRGVWGELGYTP
ncbi:hypothetical protein ES703_33070 [subsurface metagenome]